MPKRVLIIGISILAVLVVGVILYLLLFSPNRPQLAVGDNPFGDILGGNANTASDLPGEEPILQAGEEVAPRLVKVTDGPITPQTIAIVAPRDVATTTATSTPDVEIRFIERASGNVYGYRAHERKLTRLSSRTLPGIQEASWLSDGSQAFVRFLAENGDTVETYALPAVGEGGYFLQSNLADVSTAGTDTLFMLTTSSTGSIGTLALPNGTNARTLFTSVLSALRVHASTGNLIATTKPSVSLDGYAFSVNRSSGAFSRILGPLRGLTALPSPSGASVLYSAVEQGALRLSVLTVADRGFVQLPLATLSDKCVWSADATSVYCGVPVALGGSLPDLWYQGATSFTDRIWQIDLETRVASLLIDPLELAGVSIDAVGLSIDPSSDILSFTNRTDGSLWVYDL